MSSCFCPQVVCVSYVFVYLRFSRLPSSVHRFSPRYSFHGILPQFPSLRVYSKIPLPAFVQALRRVILIFLDFYFIS